MATVKPQGVIIVDDRAGNTYWIFTCHHTTGANTTIDVDDSAVSASLVGTASTTAGTCTVANTSTTDAKKEVTIDTGETTGTKTVIVRFVGSAAGTGSVKWDL